MSRALGRYELLRPLARGGMAEVFLARRRTAGVEKVLVVKRIRPERTNDVRFLDLFTREAKLSMSLAHQNIVPVFDFGKLGDQVFLAMERVEGRDLGSSLARDRMPPLLAAFVGAECCQALHYAHQRTGPDGAPLGIVHRDVTPRNVLLSWSGEVKLTDFGIAALAGEATGKLLGTPAYMAPEQARGEAVDARADVYGLGLVIREALTGERARPGDDRDALIATAKRGELAPWPGEVDGDLKAIVERATAAAVADRHADAGALHEALDAYIVANRAATQGKAPALQLAGWLAKTWEGARDEPPLEEGEAAEALSFVDEGDEMGTGTQHSMAETAADDEEVAPAPAPVAPEVPVRSEPWRVPRWLPASVVGASTLGLGVVLAVAATQTEPSVQIVAIHHTVQKATDIVVAPSGSDPVPPAPPPVPGSAAASGSAKPRVPPVQQHVEARPSGSAPPPPGSATPPPAVVVRHKATIGATPWAYFTVDDDPTQHTTVETIELAAGEHKLHFWNPSLSADRYATIEIADRDIKFVMPFDK